MSMQIFHFPNEPPLSQTANCLGPVYREIPSPMLAHLQVKLIDYPLFLRTLLNGSAMSLTWWTLRRMNEWVVLSAESWGEPEHWTWINWGADIVLFLSLILVTSSGPEASCGISAISFHYFSDLNPALKKDMQ